MNLVDVLKFLDNGTLGEGGLIIKMYVYTGFSLTLPTQQTSILAYTDFGLNAKDDCTRIITI